MPVDQECGWTPQQSIDLSKVLTFSNGRSAVNGMFWDERAGQMKWIKTRDGQKVKGYPLSWLLMNISVFICHLGLCFSVFSVVWSSFDMALQCLLIIIVNVDKHRLELM